MSVWDETEPAPPAPVPAPITEQPTADTPEPDTSQPETTPEVESPVAASEADKEPEAETLDDAPIREDVPLDEIDTRFSNTPKGGREYMKRLTHKLDEAKEALELESKYLSAVPADDLLNDLAEKSQSRHDDLGWAYYNAYKTSFLQGDPKIGMNYDELTALVERSRQQGVEAPREQIKAADIDPDDLEYLSEPIKARLAKLDELEQKYPALEGKLSKLEQSQAEAVKADTQRKQEAYEGKVEALSNNFASTVLGYAETYLADNMGLKAMPDDSPQVKDYIEAVTKSLTDRNRLFGEFNSREQYKADGDAMEDAINRLDERRLSPYISKAKVAAELILDEIAKPYLAVLKQMRSPTTKDTKPRPEITGTTPSFAPSTDLVRGKGVDALWGTPGS